MKLKGLTDTLNQITILQETICELIDLNDEDQEHQNWDSRNEMLNAAYMDIDTAFEALNDVKELRQDEF